MGPTGFGLDPESVSLHNLNLGDVTLYSRIAPERVRDGFSGRSG